MTKKTRKHPVPCPLCDIDDFSVLYEPTVQAPDPASLYGAAAGIRGTQRIVRCKGCKMIYENPRFDEEIIIAGYADSEEDDHDSQHEMRVQSFSKAIAGLSDHLPPKGARVLDVGTAGGAFLDAASQQGYEAHGMEVSKRLVARGAKRGLKIQQGTIAQHPFQSHSFDMVCLWDVIEHVVSPKAMLREIKKLLRPNGVLLINFPDIGTRMARMAREKFWWIISVHLHHFTRDSIRELCDRTGFSVVHMQRYWQILQFGYLEQMATQLNVPLAKRIHSLTPTFIRNLPIPYYASQTTALARIQEHE